MQKYAYLVELEKYCQTHIFLQISFWYSRERARQKLNLQNNFANFTNPNLAHQGRLRLRERHAVLLRRRQRGLGSLELRHEVPAAPALA